MGILALARVAGKSIQGGEQGPAGPTGRDAGGCGGPPGACLEPTRGRLVGGGDHRGGRGAADPGWDQGAPVVADGGGPASRRVPDRRQDLGDAQPAPLADGAALDIEPGQAQHQGVNRFRLGPWSLWRLVEQAPAAGELRRAGAVGEKAEVPDPDEAVGDDMEEKAADELLRLQRHHFHAAAVSVVFPAEAHDPLVEAEEALVGDGHAVVKISKPDPRPPDHPDQRL